MSWSRCPLRATLAFDLPEEQEAHYEAVNGGRYKNLISDFLEEIRKVGKYDAEFCGLKAEHCEALREWFAEQLKAETLEWP